MEPNLIVNVKIMTIEWTLGITVCIPTQLRILGLIHGLYKNNEIQVEFRVANRIQCFFYAPKWQNIKLTNVRGVLSMKCKLPTYLFDIINTICIGFYLGFKRLVFLQFLHLVMKIKSGIGWVFRNVFQPIPNPTLSLESKNTKNTLISLMNDS